MRRTMTALVTVVLATQLVVTPALADGGSYEEESLNACPDGRLDCVRRVEREMTLRTRALARACDHDVVFALVYTRVTQEYLRTLERHPGFFSDPAWVNRLDVAFAGFYFGAYDAWHERSRTGAPPAWATGFQAAQGEEISASGNLLEGVNAHIAQDLPFVLAEIGELTEAHKRDYDKVNSILRDVYPHAIAEIARRFDPSIDDSNVEGTELDEDVLFQTVVAMREEAWHNAERLAAAGTPPTRSSTATSIEANAELRAETIRAQNSYVAPVSGPSARNAHCKDHGWPP